MSYTYFIDGSEVPLPSLYLMANDQWLQFPFNVTPIITFMVMFFMVWYIMNLTIDTPETIRFPYSYFTYNDAFLAELSTYLQPYRVLEVFAGNGKLASLLQQNDIQVTPTSLHSTHDGHTVTGFFTPVEHLNAVDAVQQHSDDHDILLMCWPTVTSQCLIAAQLWKKPILFIGEVSNVEQSQYGGCATDAFFDALTIDYVFDTYRGNMLEKAFIAHLKDIDNTQK